MQSPGVVPLPSWSVRLTSELDAADVRAVALTRDLSTAQLNWKPAPETWSVGECLEHLCLSNELYVRPLEQSLRGVPAAPVDEITPGWFASWFIRKFIEPTTQKARARAPSKIVPVGKLVDASIVDRFKGSNARVRDVISHARGYDINRVRFKNPFLPLIRFTVGTGLQLLARHNHRHLLQAERVKQLPDFPDGNQQLNER